MKKVTTLIISFSLSISFLKANYWTQIANFPGVGLQYPFAFSIGNKGYVGTGKGISSTNTQQFWEYDPSVNAWTQKANFGGAARYAATGISIGNKGYAGLGLSGSMFNDFWEYDPSLNVWTQKANFGGAIRYGAAGFTIGNFGYLTCGGYGSTMFTDIWQYNPLTNTWAQKANFPGPGRRNTHGFAVGDNGYVVSGYNQFTSYSDLWEYNSINDTWTQKANMPGLARCDAAAFSICEKGYFGTGENPGMANSYYIDFWQYNPATNIWTQKANFAGTSRDEPAFFSIGSKGYIGAGGKHTPTLYNDFWEYTPDSACLTGIENAFPSFSATFSISPNPVQDFLVCSLGEVKDKVEISITDIKGKKVLTKQLTTDHGQLTIDIREFSKGIYFVTIDNGKEKAVKKFLKP